MAQYATADQFVDAFPDDVVQLTNLSNPDAATPVEARIDEVLARSSNEIDSYIGVVVSLPLTTVPLVIESKVLDIARYYLDSLDPRPDVRQRYEDAIEWLTLVSEGKLSLGVDSGGDTQAIRTLADPAISACDRVFNKTTLAGY